MTAFVTTVIVFATRIDFHTARPVAIRIVRPRCCFTNSTKLNFGKLDSIHPLRNWRACCWLSWRDSANSDKFTAHCRDMLRVATHQRRLYNSRFVPQGRSSVVEQRPFKPKVVGSIPTAPTNCDRGHSFSIVSLPTGAETLRLLRPAGSKTHWTR